MSGTRGVTSGRVIALVAGVIAALGLALIAAGQSEAGKGANKTYGLTSKTKKNGTTVNLALKKPGNVVYKSSFDFYKASKIAKWKGWGKSEVTAKAGSVKLCDVSGNRKTNCSSAKGTVMFEDPVKRRCKLKKGGKKKKVTLYSTTSFEHGSSGKYPDGRGAALQYGVLGKPACPKF